MSDDAGLISPLVSTPVPQHGESYMGFVLRTAADNGHRSIHGMLRYAGMSENEIRSARPPVNKLARLFGWSPTEFNALGHRQQQRGRFMAVGKHMLPALYLRSKEARICPSCVAEKGIIEAFWELRHAVACPEHASFASERCPACGKTHDWFRRSLGVCSCGHALTQDTEHHATSPAVTSLMATVYAKLMDRPLPEQALMALGFPVTALAKMRLTTLLGILHRLERFVVPDATTSAERLAVEAAARLLQAWPTGFHAYLAEVHGPAANRQAIGLRGQFASFYESMFKTNLPEEEIAFLRDAFSQFGEHYWKQAAIHPQLRTENLPNIVGIEGLAKALNLQPSTIRRRVAKGQIPVHAVHANTGRKLFDLSQQQVFAFAEGRTLSLDDAAEMLDIPATILRAYRTRGFFKAHFKPKRLGLFHENDVATMRDELIRDCHQVTLDNEIRFITLRQIMQKKLGPPEIKAEFIHAVRTRTIRPVGIMGDRPGGLVFEAAIVKDYLKNLQKQTQDVRSFHEVPSTLGIHPNTIASLIQRGHLSYCYVQLGFFVEQQSLLAFDRRYIAGSALAKMKGVPHSQIMMMLQELNLRPLQIHGKGRAGQRTFIDRRLLPLFGIGYEGLREAA